MSGEIAALFKLAHHPSSACGGTLIVAALPFDLDYRHRVFIQNLRQRGRVVGGGATRQLKPLSPKQTTEPPPYTVRKSPSKLVGVKSHCPDEDLCRFERSSCEYSSCEQQHVYEVAFE